MNRPLFQLILVQLREFYREPGIIFWGIIFPILMAWGLGIAFTQKGELIQTIAVIEDPAHPVPALRNFLSDASVSENKDNGGEEYTKIVADENLGKTRYQFTSTSWEGAMRLLKRGAIIVIIEEKDGKLQYHFDPLNSDAQLNYLKLSAAINRTAAAEGSAEIIPFTQTGSRYIDFLVPGLIAMGVMMSIMWGIGYSLIEKRSKKLLRRMVATPMRKSSFLISHFVARVILSIVEASLLYLFAHYYFDITIEGSLIALAAVFLAGMVAFTGIAVFVASRTAKLEIANGLINVVIMPMMILSGVFFSYHNFPDAVIPFIQKLPLTMLADSIRSIFIEGTGLKEHLVEIASMTGVGVVFFLTGLKIYKWY